jgi:hypothetical protein
MYAYMHILQGSIAIAQKLKHLWRGLKSLHAQKEKEDFKKEQRELVARPGAGGFLR